MVLQPASCGTQPTGQGAWTLAANLTCSLKLLSTASLGADSVAETVGVAMRKYCVMRQRWGKRGKSCFWGAPHRALMSSNRLLQASSCTSTCLTQLRLPLRCPWRCSLDVFHTYTGLYLYKVYFLFKVYVLVPQHLSQQIQPPSSIVDQLVSVASPSLPPLPPP